MTKRTKIATLALPLLLLACAPREPAVETELASGLGDGQRQACRSATAQQTGLTAADVSDTFQSVTPSGTAVYVMSSTAGQYRCEVDNAFQVVSLSPLGQEESL
jgi:hypothetical protein